MMLTAVNHLGVSMVVVNGENLGGVGNKSKMDAYVTAMLGDQKLQGKVQKKSTGAKVTFDEVFRMPWNGRTRNMKVCVMDKDMLTKDDLVGVGKLDLETVVKHPGPHRIALTGPKGQPAGHLNVKMDFTSVKVVAGVTAVAGVAAVPGAMRHSSSSSSSSKGKKKAAAAVAVVPVAAKKKQQSSSSSSHGKSMMLTVVNFLGVKVTVLNGQDLGGKAAGKSIDPYVLMSLADQKLKGKVQRNAGQSPMINEVYKLPWNGKARRIKIAVMDRDRVTRDDVIAVGKLDLETVVKKPGVHTISMTNVKGQPGGHLNVRVEFISEKTVGAVTPVAVVGAAAVAAKKSSSSSSSSSGGKTMMLTAVNHLGVSMVVVNGENLGGVGNKSKMDAYVTAMLGDQKLQGKVQKKSTGAKVTFDEVFRMPWNGRTRNMKVCVMDKDMLTKDDLVGVGKLDLETVVKHPGPHRIALTGPKGQPAGHLNVKMDFTSVKVVAGVTAVAGVAAVPGAMRHSSSSSSSSKGKKKAAAAVAVVPVAAKKKKQQSSSSSSSHGKSMMLTAVNFLGVKVTVLNGQD
eukprot:Lankesteria_metandrocarpae@DN5430_c1_g1_i2.p1